VPIQLVDRSREAYCCDVGRRAGGTASSSGASRPPESAKHFLRRLPKSVLRDGKVVPVRDEIAALLAPHAIARSDVSVASSGLAQPDTCSAQGDHLDGVNAAAGSSGSSVDADVLLQVKREDGKQVYVLRLLASTAMSSVFAALRRHRAADESLPPEFELRTAFPPRVYVEDGSTLGSLGLVPNATLFLRCCTGTS
jgi:UBX domain